MPCYLFTYHAWGSWLPDHPRGYVRRHTGILPPDQAMGASYRANMADDVASFDAIAQRLIIEETLTASGYQQFRCHYLATEPTHLHALVSWKTDRKWGVGPRKIARVADAPLKSRNQKTRVVFEKSKS